MPNFQEMLQSIFHNQDNQKPDFVLKTKKTLTNIFMDKATKLDIIVSTVKKMNLTDDLIVKGKSQEEEGEKI